MVVFELLDIRRNIRHWLTVLCWSPSSTFHFVAKRKSSFFTLAVWLLLLLGQNEAFQVYWHFFNFDMLFSFHARTFRTIFNIRYFITPNWTGFLAIRTLREIVQFCRKKLYVLILYLVWSKRSLFCKKCKHVIVQILFPLTMRIFASVFLCLCFRFGLGLCHMPSNANR